RATICRSMPAALRMIITGKDSEGMMSRSRSWWIWWVVALLCVLLMACAESSPSSYSAGIAAQPPAITSTALRPTVEAAQVDQYLQAIQAQATLDAVHAQQTATAIAQSATATAQAWEYAATQQAMRATATAQAWQATATAQAQAIRATATAQAQMAQAAAIAKAERATATARAWEATATVEIIVFNEQATATKAADNAIATVQAAEAEKAELEAKRARLTYPVRAYGPWVILCAAVALLLWGLYRLIQAEVIRRRVIQRDARGDAPLVVVERPGGEIVVFDPDRGFWPVTVIDAQGQVTQPALAPPELQERVTARDQAVDLATRGLPGRTPRRNSTAAARQLAAPPLYRILKPGAPLPGTIIDAQALPMLDQDWQERGSHDA
ncbi:MAG: hypothetical protein U9R05_08260, partial [Chloroflexota bacterium]|nr:hypothetical protein [Chloroflexota bacterium]